jgi:molybdopterin-guanine dinucleotide biosynthesis protein A
MNRSTKISTSAFILIGGQSKRFGYPKWKSKIGEKTLLDHIYNVCSLFDNTFIVGKKKPAEFNKPFLKDKFDFQAPINGIFSSLEKSNSDWSFIISIDLPLMTPSIIKEIWESGNKSQDVIMPRIKDYLQPVCAFYHKRILPQISNQIEKNELSLHSLINNIKTDYLDMDNYSKEFSNMNTQKEYNEINKDIMNN